MLKSLQDLQIRETDNIYRLTDDETLILRLEYSTAIVIILTLCQNQQGSFFFLKKERKKKGKKENIYIYMYD